MRKDEVSVSTPARVTGRDDEFYLTDGMSVFLVCGLRLIYFVNQPLTHDHMALLTLCLTLCVSVGPEPSFPCTPVLSFPQLPRLLVHVLVVM